MNAVASNEHPKFEIDVLGPMAIRVGGLEQIVTASQERATLALLAMRSGRVVSVSEISRALWGDKEPKTAIKSIQMHISKLRRILPTGSIQTVSPGYRAVINPGDVDALRFEALLQATHPDHGNDPEADARTLSAALELWRGPALLDLCDNDLGRNEATRLWELRLTAEEQRFDVLLACGQHRSLVAELMASVDAEPLREQRWALLMRALYRCGRQAEALRTFQRLRDYLATELGVEPSPQVSALELSILRNDPELNWTPPPGTIASRIRSDLIDSAAASSPVPLSRRLSVRPPVGLIGRTRELEVIEEALKRVTTSEVAGLVLVNGEAGSGKTALLAAAARAAAEAGACILFGHCEEDLAVPYQLFVESLSHYFAHADQSQFFSYVAEHGSELTRLAPTLERMVPRQSWSRSTNTDTERAILFKEVVGLLATISKYQPVVLAFDDLQWADPASLQLLRHLVTAEQSMRVIVIGVYRDSGSSQSGPLLETLGLLRRQDEVDRIELRGLDRDGVVSYLEAAAGHPLDETLMRLARDIFLETDGNPFFVSEVLRHLVDVGTIQRGETGQWTAVDSLQSSSLPDSVSEVIGARILRLGQSTRGVLSMAATIGRDFDLDLLAQATSDPEDEVLNVLDAAVAASLVREIVGSPGQYSFVHALIQHTLYEDLGSTRRARAHRRLGESLEEICRDNPGARVGELARHWSNTGQTRDWPKAVEYCHQAADAALAGLAPADALSYYTQALGICAQIEVDPGVALDLTVGMGITQRQTGSPAYRETLLEASRRARELGDTERLIRAALANDRSWFITGVVDEEKVAILEQALSLLDADDPRRALVLATLCQELAYHSSLERRRELAEEALSIAKALDEDATTVWVLNLVSMPLLVPPLLPELRERTSHMLERAKLLEDPTVAFWAVNQRCTIAACSADFEEVDRCLEFLGQQALLLNRPTTSWYYTYTCATRALIAGDIERAEDWATRALNIGSDGNEPDALTFFGTQLMMLNWQRGTLAEMVPLMEQFATEHTNIPAYLAALATAYVEVPEINKARALLERFAREDFQLPFDQLWLTGMVHYADTAIECADIHCAEQLFSHLVPWSDQWVYSGAVSAGPVSYYLGGLAAVLGRNDEASDYLERSAALCKTVGAKFFAARTDLAWGKMLVARDAPGDPTWARKLFTKAETASRRHGYRTVEMRASLQLSHLSDR